MSEKQHLDLDKSLAAGKRPEDPETASLFDAAAGLKDALPSEAPGSHLNKALFVQSVAARRRRFGPVRFLAPALACLLLLAGVAVLGRTAAPGDELYSVRTALQAFGLAESPEEEADARIAEANGALTDARELLASEPEASQRLVLGAIADLDRARRLLRDETGVARQLSLIATLEDRAVNLLVQIESPPQPTPGEKDDNSGPGGGDEDNSGPGGGDDDNSGPGGGGDDNSGPGGGGDDSSGPGSGGDDSGGGDSSGSGSGDDDSSGSGSGSGDTSGSNSGPGGGGGDDSSGSGSGSSTDSSGPGSGDDSTSGSG
jgi:hypothetical protein